MIFELFDSYNVRSAYAMMEIFIVDRKMRKGIKKNSKCVNKISHIKMKGVKSEKGKGHEGYAISSLRLFTQHPRQSLFSLSQC
jgi:hypothetical protein